MNSSEAGSPNQKIQAGTTLLIARLSPGPAFDNNAPIALADAQAVVERSLDGVIADAAVPSG
jgi:hypothetical protein